MRPQAVQYFSVHDTVVSHTLRFLCGQQAEGSPANATPGDAGAAGAVQALLSGVRGRAAARARSR